MSLHIAAKKGQIAESILLPGDPLRAEFIAENFLRGAEKYTDIRNMYGFTGTYKGVPVSVQGTGMGMPSMGIYSWELITEYGVQNLIRIGTAGAFTDELALGDIFVALAASTDSNYQHAFDLPGQYSPSASWALLTKALAASSDTGIPFKAGNVVTCDVFYEFGDWWKKWAKMGVQAVEMETAALYMNAAYNHVNALSMISISDNFVTGAKSSVEERQNSFTNMMKLALDMLIQRYSPKDKEKVEKYISFARQNLPEEHNTLFRYYLYCYNIWAEMRKNNSLETIEQELNKLKSESRGPMTPEAQIQWEYLTGVFGYTYTFIQ